MLLLVGVDVKLAVPLVTSVMMMMMTMAVTSGVAATAAVMYWSLSSGRHVVDEVDGAAVTATSVMRLKTLPRWRSRR